MKGKVTPVEVISDFKNEFLRTVLPKGFNTAITAELRDSDYTYSITYKHGKEFITEKQTLPKGEFTGYTFLGANGETYCSRWLEQMIGPKPIT